MEFSPFFLTIIWNIIVAIWIIIVVLITKVIKDKLTKYLEYITATTVWLLLWIIFIGFLPELSSSWNFEWSELWIFILIWIFIFYLLELFLHWHHCKDLGHENECHSHHTLKHENGLLMFGWTMLHNAFHGIVLFAAFSVNFWFWVATTIAVLLHSIPQNIVNYIMNYNNIKYAYFAAFWWILWALITYPFADYLIDNKFYILAIITGGLLYTALADIFPEFKWNWSTWKKISYLVFILIWIFTFIWFELLVEWWHDDNSHENEIQEKIDIKESSLKCTKAWWNWIIWINECEWISKKTCEEIWWNFNECASACRNNPEAEECIMMCVQVCEFDN